MDLNCDGTIRIGGKIVGRLQALTWGGQEQNPTGSKQQVKTVFYKFEKPHPKPQVKTAFYKFEKPHPKPNEQTRIVLDLPIYLPWGIQPIINPALEEAITQHL